MSLLAPEGAWRKARDRRRLYPIHFYAGKNGSGKSLAAVLDTMPTLDAGRPVLSTVRILDWTNPRPCDDDGCSYLMHGADPAVLGRQHMAAHPLYVPFTKWEQLLEFEGGDVVMDEITGVADSNESHSMPSAVRNILPQLRRRDIALRITGLNWIRADKRIRESVNALTMCKSSFPESRKDENGKERLWRRRRLAAWTTYDAQTLPMDDISRTQLEKADRLFSSRHWIPDSPAIKAYETFDPVLSVGTVNDAGRCVTCGGSRRAPECSCPEYVTDRAARKAGAAAGAERRSGSGGRDTRRVHNGHSHGGSW